MRDNLGMYVVPKIELDETMEEIKRLALQIREKKFIMKEEARVNKQSRKPTIPRTAGSKVSILSGLYICKDISNISYF